MSCKPACDCTVSMTNTGMNGCAPLINVARKIILVPTLDSTGVRNKITIASAVNAAYFTAFINQSDASKRWYPLPNVVDVDDKRGDAIMQELSNRSKIFVADGTRTFSGMIWGKDGNGIMKGIIDSVRCNEMSAFIVDKNGNLIVGEVSEDGVYAYPFILDSQSVVGTPIYGTDTTVQGVKLSFNFSQDQDDACIRMIQSTNFTDVDLRNLAGLRNVCVDISAITVNGCTAFLYTNGIEAGKKIPIQGLVTADFISVATSTTSKARRTNNTPADIAITVTEGTGANVGKYAVVFTVAASDGDTIVLDALKAGFDFTCTTQTTITVVD